MFSVIDAVIGSVLIVSTALYFCLSATPPRPEPPMDLATRKVDILLDELIILTKGLQGQYSSAEFDQFHELFNKLLLVDLGDPRYRSVWPKSTRLQTELDSVFSEWVDTGARLEQNIESLPTLTVNTVDRWISIKDEILKFEIRSADYDHLYETVSKTPSQVKFTKKAISLRDRLEARAARTVPQFPDQFLNQVVQEQIRFWCDQVRDMALDPVLKEIAIGAGESRLQQLERRRILEED
jgi:hypothetical protein